MAFKADAKGTLLVEQANLTLLFSSRSGATLPFPVLTPPAHSFSPDPFFPMQSGSALQSASSVPHATLPNESEAHLQAPGLPVLIIFLFKRRHLQLLLFFPW